MGAEHGAARPLRRWLVRLGWLAAFATVCVAGLEIALRIAAPVPLDSPRFRTSARYCTELVPSNDGVLTTVDFRHSFHVDASGRRRDPNRPPAGARTVAVVGDSMVFGEGVADHQTFVAELPAALAARGGGPWDAWNLGIGGQGTAQNVARLEDLLASGAHPDVAIVAFFSNDPRDDRECRPYRLAPDGHTLERVVPAIMAHPPPRRLPWLVAQPWYRWVTAHSQIVGRIRLLAMHAAAARPAHAVAPGRARLGALDEPIDDPERQLMAALYRRLADDARTHGLPIGILLIPHKGCFEAAVEACDAKLAEVTELAHAAGLPVLDLRSALRAMAPARLYYPHDLHWTPAGQRAVVAPIAAWILTLVGGRPGAS